tara:strand:- start:220 stop:597 length:378 start_codon:yes stop_codon:yes gene_type:complete
MNKLRSLILKKELSILHDNFSNKIENILGDELWEISANGSMHNRVEICSWLKNKATDSCWEITGFEIKKLAEGLVLAYYQVKSSVPLSSNANGSIHSSVWKKNGESTWQIIFHQATNLSCELNKV